MVIPPNQLSTDVLQGVLEEFIGREGTDYGAYEFSLAEKVQHLMPQVLCGDVVIVFDELTEQITLLTREALRLQESKVE
jgi:uncharacterized protein